MDAVGGQQAPLDHSADLSDDLDGTLSDEYDEEDDEDAIEGEEMVHIEDVMDQLHSEDEVIDPSSFCGEQIEQKKDFQCGYCDYSTNRQSDLKRHVFGHTGENLFHCSKCEYKTARKSDLRRHQLLHIGEKPFKCGVCHYTTSRKTVLLKHMRIHTANRPRCRVILVQVSKEGQRVINNNALADMPVAAAEIQSSGTTPTKKKAELKMYSCDKCDFVAACRKNFHEHKLSHGTEQKWKCPMCGYLTIRKSDMTRHFNIHIDNVFKCNICEYKTVRHSDFIRHNKVHEKHSYNELE